MPVSRKDSSSYHERTLKWRAIQADNMLRHEEYLTLQKLADLVGMTKQATRYFCQQRMIPYKGFGRYGFTPTLEQVVATDKKNGLREFVTSKVKEKAG